MLGGAIMMEISIAMIILSRVLKYGINRWVNIITASSRWRLLWAGEFLTLITCS
jgi:hypothetical protein